MHYPIRTNNRKSCKIVLKLNYILQKKLLLLFNFVIYVKCIYVLIVNEDSEVLNDILSEKEDDQNLV